MTSQSTETTFSSLGLHSSVLKALGDVGYETPSPIQAKAIPVMLEGKDILGQAQTGTGKTAAFALPILSRIDLRQKQPQVLVLVPTRELAIQVAEAFQRYAHHMKGFHVMPVYGGQSYTIQLKQLKRGAHVIVGTPGRVMDHMRRGTLKLEGLQTLVLDEADEMLRMGFIDDVTWVLEQTPSERQIALFSATMPAAIRNIANTHLRSPEHITIQVKTTTADTVQQHFWMVSARQKTDALTRILEVEDFDAVIIFVRTKIATEELSEKLEARGYAAAPLSGDVTQKQREITVKRLKSGQLDILVATDVAARGLDVDRISHVINYDMPHDSESYVHRIGRTGRAGRKGEAILFVTPREKRMLSVIERTTRQKIARWQEPSVESINRKRVDQFKQQVLDAFSQSSESHQYDGLIAEMMEEQGVSASQLAAVMARMLQGNQPLFVEPMKKPEKVKKDASDRAFDKREEDKPRRPKKELSSLPAPNAGMERYSLKLGIENNVDLGDVVGALVNELGLENDFIEQVCIGETTTTVDLPEGMPNEVFNYFKQMRIRGCKTNAEKIASSPQPVRGKRSGKKPASAKGGSRRRDGGRKPGAGQKSNQKNRRQTKKG